MASMSRERQCAHPGCSCPATGDGDYCSPVCQARPDSSICECGHAECEATPYKQS